MSGVERHELPNGGVVFYRDSDHAYWKGYEGGKCSGRIPGISTIAKNCGDTNNDGLIDWGAKLSCEGVARELSQVLSLDDEDIRHALGWAESGESIWDTLKQEKLTWRNIRDEAGTRGSRSHDILQRLANDEDAVGENGYDRAVIDWWATADPAPQHVESVVYSEKHGFAGRFDLLADMGDNWLTLADLKTSKWIGNSFAVQLNLYRIAAIECGYPAPDRLMVIQVREDGTWREVDIPINEDWALSALAIYRAGSEIRSAIRSAMKAAA